MAIHIFLSKSSSKSTDRTSNFHEYGRAADVPFRPMSRNYAPFANLCTKVTAKIDSMRNALSRRIEKPLESDRGARNKAKVLKFDRRAGLVVLDVGAPIAKTKPFWGLVRDLLVFLRLRAPVARKPKTTTGIKSAKGRRR